MNEIFFLLSSNQLEAVLQILNKLPYGEVNVIIRELQSLQSVSPQPVNNGQSEHNSERS